MNGGTIQGRDCTKVGGKSFSYVVTEWRYRQDGHGLVQLRFLHGTVRTVRVFGSHGSSGERVSRFSRVEQKGTITGPVSVPENQTEPKGCLNEGSPELLHFALEFIPPILLLLALPVHKIRES